MLFFAKEKFDKSGQKVQQCFYSSSSLFLCGPRTHSRVCVSPAGSRGRASPFRGRRIGPRTTRAARWRNTAQTRPPGGPRSRKKKDKKRERRGEAQVNYRPSPTNKARSRDQERACFTWIFFFFLPAPRRAEGRGRWTARRAPGPPFLGWWTNAHVGGKRRREKRYRAKERTAIHRIDV